jgi:hypothetical protein
MFELFFSAQSAVMPLFCENLFIFLFFKNLGKGIMEIGRGLT